MSGISRINRLLPHIKLHPTQLNTYCEVEDIILHELNDLLYLSMMSGWDGMGTKFKCSKQHWNKLLVKMFSFEAKVMVMGAREIRLKEIYYFKDYKNNCINGKRAHSTHRVYCETIFGKRSSL